MDHVVWGAFRNEVSKLATCKLALLERLVRLGATDIPNTPRLLMRKRTPGELAALQQGVEAGWDSHVTAPLMRVAEHGLRRLPSGKIRQLATAGARVVAEDPVGALVTNVLPVPGASPAWIATKRGLEHAIDRITPTQG